MGIVILVSIGLILRSVFSHVRFALGLRSSLVLDDQPLIDLVLRECDSLAVGRRPALREVPSLAAPAVFGLFRQTICIPPGLTKILSEQELRWVTASLCYWRCSESRWHNAASLFDRGRKSEFCRHTESQR